MGAAPAAGAGGARRRIPDPPAVELRGVVKRFDGVCANDGVDLTAHGGQIHCLLGENGAGKTTLMNVLAGLYRPDEGELFLGGQRVEFFRPRDAIDRGIGMVHQQTDLIAGFSVLENLMLGDRDGLRLRTRAARERLQGLCDLLGLRLDPDVEVGRLALGQQQQVEIVRALWRDPAVLILDEPTSMLTPQGVGDLERVLRQLRTRGMAIIFITHKLREALETADRVSVMRRGRIAGSIGPEEMSAAPRREIERRIVGQMFPDDSALADEVPELRAAIKQRADGRAAAGTLRRRRCDGEEAILELDGITVHGRHGETGIERPLTLSVWRGEVVGIAGVDGNGQRALVEAVAGQRRLAGGDIRLLGRSVARAGVAARQRLGLRYVSDDREGEALVGSLPISLNLLLKRIGVAPFWRRGFIRGRLIDDHARRLLDEFGIDVPGPQARAGTLSGGTMQKTVLARELSLAPAVVVFNKPTYGLDVKTTAMVRARVRSLAEEGAALVISTDLEELLELCDRIGVLVAGALAGMVENDAGAEQRIGALMIGTRADG